MTLALLALLASGPDDWAEFRGPGGTGLSPATSVPKEWSETKNVTWKTALHGRGWSSPVVFGSQVWLSTGTPDGKALSVICVDRESGKILLDRKLFEPENPDQLWRKYNSYASPTPVVEDGRVYVHFGTYGTACLDTKTFKPIWARTDLSCNHWRGAGSSPILHENLLILTFDGYDQQYLVALDKTTGKDVWKTPRSHDFKTDDGDRKKGYSTPVVVDVGGKPQLISPASAATVALDPKTGKLLWWIRHKGHSPAMRSLLVNGLVVFGVGAGNELVAVKPDGHGELPESAVVWKAGKGIGHKPSPLLVDDLLYVIADNGVASCFDAKTGASVWTQRVGGAFSASPIHADGAVYLQAEDGTCTVLKPGREYKEIAKNKLDGGAETKATPAIAGKSIFIRTESSLYRIDAK
jgi:outer membrane protein assembly factor BamB